MKVLELAVPSVITSLSSFYCFSRFVQNTHAVCALPAVVGSLLHGVVCGAATFLCRNGSAGSQVARLLLDRV